MDLKTKLAAVKSKKAAPPNDAVAPFQGVVEARGRMYCWLYGLWISLAAASTGTRPTPHVNLQDVSRFASKQSILAAEVEGMFQAFTTLPQDVNNAELLAIVGRSPWFTKTVSERVLGLRTSV